MVGTICSAVVRLARGTKSKSSRKWTELAAATSVATAQRILADLSGAWTLTVSLPDRSSSSLVDWKQKGDSLSGTIELENIGSRPITGVVKGDTVRFNFTIDMQGQAMAINGSCIVRDKDTLDGQLSLPNDMGSFPYAGKRKQ